jgi:hypothetical protein
VVAEERANFSTAPVTAAIGTDASSSGLNSTARRHGSYIMLTCEPASESSAGK